MRPETRDLATRVWLRKRVQSTDLDIVNRGHSLIYVRWLSLGSWTGVTYLRYAVLMSHNKDETALPLCGPARDPYR